MKKIYDAVDRFCARHPRFGIPDLMRWIVIGNVAVYILMLLTMRADANALSFLYLDGGKVLRGEIWRIITFIFVPASSRKSSGRIYPAGRRVPGQKEQARLHTSVIST